jgi:hypothetical protein
MLNTPKQAKGRLILGCLIGLVSVIVLLVTVPYIAGGNLHASCSVGPTAKCASPENPLGLPDIALQVLFVFGAIGTAGSGLQVVWRLGKSVVGRFREPDHYRALACLHWAEAHVAPRAASTRRRGARRSSRCIAHAPKTLEAEQVRPDALKRQLPQHGSPCRLVAQRLLWGPGAEASPQCYRWLRAAGAGVPYNCSRTAGVRTGQVVGRV